MERRRFISDAVDGLQSRILATPAGPPRSSKMSETLVMAKSVRESIEPVNIISVSGDDNNRPMSKEAGDRLREARKKHFSSATKAAKFFRMTPSTYTAHENGQNAFNVDQCARYAEKYGVSPTWLAWGEGEPASGIGDAAALSSRLSAWIRGVTEGLRPEASQAAVDELVRVALRLLHNPQSALQSPSDPNLLRQLARYEAGKLLD